MSENGYDSRLLARIPGTLAFKKRQTIWHAILVCGLIGTVDGLASREDSQSDLWLVEGILLAVFALRWCALDSEELCRRIGRWMGLTIFLIAIVGVPIHLLRTRGMRRGLVACAVFAGLLCLLIGIEWVLVNGLIAISDWRQGE